MKEVKILPSYEDACKYRTFIKDFMNSKKGIVEVFGIPVSRSGNPIVASLTYQIRRLGISNEVFATTRRKKTYLINIKISGIRKQGYGRIRNDHEKHGHKHLEDIIKS